MKLPEINEPEEPAKEDPNGPTAPRTVHIVAARKPAEAVPPEPGPAQAAAEIKAKLPPPEERKEEPQPSGETHTPEEKPQRNKGLNPGKKLRSIILAGKNSPRIQIPLKYRLRPDKSLLRRAVWDVSSIISLAINIVLVVIVVVLGSRLQQLQSTVNSLLGGLYDNFVRMDNSVISTSVSVNQPIELDFNLPVVQPSTNVTLTDDVVIRNATVIINTGVLNINSRATVTLPAGTTLPVSLSMDVPVKTTIPVNLTIPINIKLSDAGSPDPSIANLHEAFTGLQNTIGPFYCLLQPGAIDSAGRYICEQGFYVQKPLR
jgi:hypothetical protein